MRSGTSPPDGARQREALVLAGLPGTVIVRYDRALRAVEVGGLAAAEGPLGASSLGRHLRDVVSPEEYAPLEPVFAAALRGEGGSATGHAGGRELRVDVAPFVDDGEVAGVLAVWRDVSAERAAERERRETERRSSVVFDGAPIGMLMIAPEGRVLDVNPAMCAILGYTAEELRAQAPLHGVHPDDADHVRERLAGLSPEDEAARVLHRVVRRDGTIAWVDSRTTLVTDEAGAPAYVLAQVIDITEQHTTAQRLIEQHAFTSTVLDTAASLVVVLDRDGVIRRFNRACQRTSGLAAEDVLGRPLWELEVLPEADLAGYHAVFDDLDPNAFPSSNTNEWHTPDGRRHVIEWRNAALLDEHGDVAFIVATGSDVTEQREAQAALEASEQRFLRAFEQAPIGMALLDRDGCFVQINQALCDMVGYDREALQRLGFRGIAHPDDLAQGERARAAIATGETDALRVERRYLRADGELLWGAVSASVLRDADGTLEHVLVQVMDITERKRVELQLQHLAHHDPLTGLANRRRFEAELAAHLEVCAAAGPRGALLILDVDHFKRVNDTLGHGTGDDLIVRIGTVLRRSLRAGDLVARLGGDEFAILLPDAGGGEAVVVAEKLVAAAHGVPGLSPSGEPHGVTISLGVLLFADLDALTARTAIARADEAMYAAKQAGRDRYRVHGRQPLRAVA